MVDKYPTAFQKDTYFKGSKYRFDPEPYNRYLRDKRGQSPVNRPSPKGPKQVGPKLSELPDRRPFKPAPVIKPMIMQLKLKGKTVPKVPYRKPKIRLGSGMLDFLKMHPALRTALHVWDVYDYFKRGDGPGDWDYAGAGWTECWKCGDNPPAFSRMQSTANCSTFVCLDLQTYNGEVEAGTDIQVPSGVRRIFTGPGRTWDNTQQKWLRMRFERHWARSDQVPEHTIPWVPGEKTQAVPRPAPTLPEYMPWLDPDLIPPGQFLPQPPIPPPFPLINWPRPGRQVGNRPSGTARDDPSDRTKPTPQTKPQSRPRRPTKSETMSGLRERKIFGPWARGLLAVWSAATEAVDYVDALFEALPKGTCKGGGLAAKSYCVYRNFHLINWKQAVQNLVYNAIEDGIAGRIIGALDRVGIGVGFNGVVYLKQATPRLNR